MTPLLRAHDIHVSYGPRPVLTGVSLSVHPGEIVALIGPNGAGKTTLLKALAGLLTPQAGRVDVAGPRARTVAYLAQSEEVPADWTAREVVELGRWAYAGMWRSFDARDARAAWQAMKRTDTLPLADRLLGTLSGGERQRIAVARALAQEPRALLLDEPAAHLDIRNQIELFALLRAEASRGVGIVVVVHDLGSAAQADRCVLLSRGRVHAEGASLDVLRSDILGEVYGVDLEVLRTPDGRIAILRSEKKEKAWKPTASS